MNFENKACCLCGGNAGQYGNNPAPLKSKHITLNVCCDECNINKVIPARLAWAKENRDAFSQPKQTKKEEEKPKAKTLLEIEAEYTKHIEETGGVRYKARAECFYDVLNAFNIIYKYNESVERKNTICVISPTIRGSAMLGADFDFWTDAPLIKIQWLLNKKGSDLHRKLKMQKRILDMHKC